MLNQLSPIKGHAWIYQWFMPIFRKVLCLFIFPLPSWIICIILDGPIMFLLCCCMCDVYHVLCWDVIWQMNFGALMLCHILHVIPQLTTKIVMNLKVNHPTYLIYIIFRRKSKFSMAKGLISKAIEHIVILDPSFIHPLFMHCK